MSTGAQVELPEVVKGYVRGLTVEQQDRLLTKNLSAAGTRHFRHNQPPTDAGCLMQVAEDNCSAPYRASQPSPVARAFDAFTRQSDGFVGAGNVAPKAMAILRDFILELRAEAIKGPGSSTIPQEPSRFSFPQLVPVLVALLLLVLQ